MCLAYPGVVKEIDGLSAIVQYPSSSRKVLIGEKKVKIGDSVLVQMGIIIKIISQQESKDILAAWKEMEK